mmetsp:Transcript_35783/g.64925  ORF Transcript_35783/g.64925 Transcript_35783/m.64925 type:complete len:278 (-) Transcript_35783:358-1191(-)
MIFTTVPLASSKKTTPISPLPKTRIADGGQRSDSGQREKKARIGSYAWFSMTSNATRAIRSSATCFPLQAACNRTSANTTVGMRASINFPLFLSLKRTTSAGATLTKVMALSIASLETLRSHCFPLSSSGFSPASFIRFSSALGACSLLAAPLLLLFVSTVSLKGDARPLSTSAAEAMLVCGSAFNRFDGRSAALMTSGDSCDKRGGSHSCTSIVPRLMSSCKAVSVLPGSKPAASNAFASSIRSSLLSFSRQADDCIPCCANSGSSFSNALRESPK